MVRILKRNKVLTDAILYALATGLNRGSLLLMFPILLTFLGVGDYGIFVLAFSIAQMLVPFLTISGTAGIIREGANDYPVGLFLLNKFIVIVAANFGVFLLIKLISYKIFDEWVYFSLFFGFLNSFFELFLSFYRTAELKSKYITFTIIKALLLLISVVFAKLFGHTLFKTFVFILIPQVVLNLYLLFVVRYKLVNNYGTKAVSLRSVLKYTIFIIPHGLALWLMNSSDKVVIKYFLNEKQLGIYSIAYTVASLQILVNSGLSIALPQIVYKDVELWQRKNQRLKVVAAFGLISLVFNLIIVFALYIDKKYFNLIKDADEVRKLISIIIPGLYLAGIYQFYSIFIFYERRTKNLFLIGLIVAAFNIILNVILVPKIGILGAAVTTFFTYLFYLSLILCFVFKSFPNLKIGFLKESICILIITFFNFLIFIF